MSSLVVVFALVLGEPCTIPHDLERGARARCDGVLVSPKRADRALMCLVQDLPNCKAALRFERAERRAETTSLIEQLAARETQVSALVRHLNRATSMTLAPRARNEAPRFDAVATAVAVGLVVGGVVALVYEAR